MSRTRTGSPLWKNGRWVGSFTLEGGQRQVLDLDMRGVPKTPASRAEAQKRCAKIAKELWKHKVTKGSLKTARSGAQTVRQLVPQWFALLERRFLAGKMSRATRDEARTRMRALMPLIGDCVPAELTVPKLRQVFRDIPGTTRGAAYVKGISNALRGFLDDAIDEGWCTLTTNPMRERAVLRELPRVVPVAPEDIVTLPEASARALVNDHRLPEERRAMYLVAFCSGLRVSELQGIRRSDLVLDEGIPFVRIEAQRSRYDGKAAPLKTPNCRRQMPLRPELVEPLRALSDNVTGSAFLFAQVKHAARQLQDDLTACELPVTNAKGRPYTFTHIRHTFASWLGRADVSADVADRLLGHSPSSTRTRHYAATSLERMYDAIMKLPSLVSASQSFPTSFPGTSTNEALPLGSTGTCDPSVARSGKSSQRTVLVTRAAVTDSQVPENTAPDPSPPTEQVMPSVPVLPPGNDCGHNSQASMIRLAGKAISVGEFEMAKSVLHKCLRWALEHEDFVLAEQVVAKLGEMREAGVVPSHVPQPVPDTAHDKGGSN